MRLTIPRLSLVVLIGPSASGKSTFAARHFLPTEIVSSDYCRALVGDDENDRSVTADAFELVRSIAEKRLRHGRLTVIDATNVEPEARRPFVELARSAHVLPVAIVFDLPERLLHERHRERSDRAFSTGVIARQRSQMIRRLRGLEREGFRRVIVLRSEEDIESVTIEREPLWNDRTDEVGPFDIIGDVHGCADELEELLDRLGYERIGHGGPDGIHPPSWRHPAGRRAVFVGDLVDRGPRILDTVEIVRTMVESGAALAVPGNHDVKLLRLLRGEKVKVTHGLDRTMAEIDAIPEEERRAVIERIRTFLDGLISHYVFDGGRLVVAHAGLREEMHGRASRAVREFALYGETTGETDEFGLPVRYDWASEYRGSARVVYGHTPVPDPVWLNNTINIDTGCVFGGALTALRWPELDLLSVPARAVYADPIRPIAPVRSDTGRLDDRILDMEEYSGRRLVETGMIGTVSIPAENGAAALELLSRFAIDPRWLVYIPPTMSPSETTKREGMLEHPDEVFRYFRREGVRRVICEEKHMGSRACVLLFRDADAARVRLGVEDGRRGVCHTRTGRPFFQDEALEKALIERIGHALETAGTWDRLNSDWLLLDCELMPWSVKAQALLVEQYAAVGSAARHGIAGALASVDSAARRSEGAGELHDRLRVRQEEISRYVDAYGRYCWPVASIDDIRIAPFHILAGAEGVHVDRDHLWHIETIRAFVEGSGDPLLRTTRYMTVDTGDEASLARGVAWWEEMTEAGGEGMVVKPIEFVARSHGRLVQPALKCRGREYLRIIYGPEYLVPENLERLRPRNVKAKRSLAVREFALGVEGLERFVRREPLRRVHECVHAVLALESEPIDPRL